MDPDDLLAIARDTTRKAGVMTNSISIEVGVLPPCDLCRKMRHTHTIATYDGATVYGPWAYMCTDCFDTYGIGLGTGRGQVLLLKPPYDLPPVSDKWETCNRCGKEYAYPHLCREHMLCGVCHPPFGRTVDNIVPPGTRKAHSHKPRLGPRAKRGYTKTMTHTNVAPGRSTLIGRHIVNENDVEFMIAGIDYDDTHGIIYVIHETDDMGNPFAFGACGILTLEGFRILPIAETPLKDLHPSEH